MTSKLMLLALLASACAFQVAHGRSLQQVAIVHDHDDHTHRAELVGDRMVFTDPIAIEELRGLWLGDGDQYPKSVYEIFEDATSLPNCSAHPNEFTYEHYNPSDDHYTMIYGSNGTIGRVTAGHKLTTAFSIANYTNFKIVMTNNKTGVTTCQFFKPFINLRTGHLQAEIINKNQYSRNATGHRVSKSLNCEVTGEELPGCTPVGSNQVQTFSAGTPASASSPAQASGESAISVNIATYTCRNGVPRSPSTSASTLTWECLSLAPKFAEEGHSH